MSFGILVLGELWNLLSPSRGDLRFYFSKKKFGLGRHISRSKTANLFAVFLFPTFIYDYAQVQIWQLPIERTGGKSTPDFPTFSVFSVR